MKALVIYENNLPNIKLLACNFDSIKVASFKKDNAADYLPSNPIKFSHEGFDFISKIKDIKDYDVIFFSNEVLSKEVASLYAGKNGLGVISHVSEIKVHKDNSLSFIVYGWGNLAVEIMSKTKPTVCILHSSTSKDKYNPLTIDLIEVSNDESLNLIETRYQNIDDKIKTKIAIGIGLGVSKDLFEKIFFIAEKLGAEIVCTRPVSDMGYLPYEKVIGDTGKEIETDFYIALGISGSIQHLSGVQAKTIIAVNSDPNAPIFAKAQIKINDSVERVIEGLFQWAKSF
ncbi:MULTISPECIES: electron transfer flavoprotein subunit alpha/FixB family protein [Caldisericum]|jgi:electron transfer flavoprotein alpha subunit|uniref:electron transfer flavoprotein subunit alpha/FixB family protein n=1 Tax=Caldisericum TaxID=693074 RepID=UPI000CC9882E|nr:MAG: hypothetical protein C0174_02325 [Thermodesulfobium narugense]